MSNYFEEKTSSDYVLKYLLKFQVPMIRQIDGYQSKKIIEEIDLITETLKSLKNKIKDFTNEVDNQ